MTFEEFYGNELVEKMASPLPDGYEPFRVVPEYIRRERITVPALEEPVMGRGPVGIRWRHGPLRFERFYSDVEPSPDPLGPLRLVIWQRTARKDAPRGWWPGDRNMGPLAGGMGVLDDYDYVSRWRPHARRQMRKWVQNRDAGLREIVELDLEAFLVAYGTAEMSKMLKWLYAKVVREKVKSHGTLVKLWGSRRMGGKIDAGLVTVDIPEASTSVHLAAFIGGTAKDDGVGTGLIDVWFKHCLENRIRFFDMGRFWAPGDLDEFKGFSRFKAQFDVRLIICPRPLIRIMGKWGVR